MRWTWRGGEATRQGPAQAPEGLARKKKHRTKEREMLGGGGKWRALGLGVVGVDLWQGRVGGVGGLDGEMSSPGAVNWSEVNSCNASGTRLSKLTRKTEPEIGNGHPWKRRIQNGSESDLNRIETGSESDLDHGLALVEEAH